MILDIIKLEGINDLGYNKVKGKSRFNSAKAIEISERVSM